MAESRVTEHCDICGAFKYTDVECLNCKYIFRKSGPSLTKACTVKGFELSEEDEFLIAVDAEVIRRRNA